MLAENATKLQSLQVCLRNSQFTNRNVDGETNQERSVDIDVELTSVPDEQGTGLMTKISPFLGCVIALAAILYVVLPCLITEPYLTILLYSTISLAMASLGVLVMKHLELIDDIEKEKDQHEQMKISVAMELTEKDAIAHQNENFRQLVASLEMDKNYLTQENKKLWRDIDHQRRKIRSLEDCLERFTESDSSDDEDDEEDGGKVTDGNSCIICMERERNIVTGPCRHLCLCSHCARKVKQCPLCRKKIKNHVKIFSS